MLKNRFTCFVALALSATAFAQDPPESGAVAPAPAAPAQARPLSPAATAIRDAAGANKFIFALFYRTEDEAMQAARTVLETALPKFADRAGLVAVNITDPKERALVAKYQLNRSPMPLVLAIAPNGAVTRGFPGKITEEQLETAFVSPGMQNCLKALQGRKMVFLCVQNGATRYNAEAMQGVQEFAADPEYAKTTELITVDPTDAAEESMLQQFKVDPNTEEAVTVFLAPPGTKIATYTGKTQKDVLVAAAKTAAKGCDPKSGCCPPKKPAQPQAKPEPAQPGNPEQKP